MPTARADALCALPFTRILGLFEAVGQTLGGQLFPVFGFHLQRAFRDQSICKSQSLTALRRPQAALHARLNQSLITQFPAPPACFPQGWSGPFPLLSFFRSGLPRKTQSIPHMRAKSLCPRHGPALRCVCVFRDPMAPTGDSAKPLTRDPLSVCLATVIASTMPLLGGYGGTGHAIRQRLATLTEAQWNQLMPCNTPEVLRQLRQETSDRTQWGGGCK